MRPVVSRAALVALWRAALARCDAGALVERRLRARPPAGPVFVLALGKPAGAMAEGAGRALGRKLVGGLVVGPPGTVAPIRGFGLRPPPVSRRSRIPPAGLDVEIGSHPIPDARSAAAGLALWQAAASVPRGVLPLLLVAGGGSALAVLPAEGLPLSAKLAAHRALFRSGLPIQEINAVRAHLSRLKGGGLLRALGPRRVRVEVLSDIGSGEIAPVASGPCSPDPTTFADCLAAVRASAAPLPRAAIRYLQEGSAGLHPETAKPGDPLFARVRSHRLAGPGDLLDAAARLGRAAGFRVVRRRAPIAGDWRRVAEELGAWLAAPAPRVPTLWVAVGEAAVALPSRPGDGGRAQQLVLSLLPALGAPSEGPAAVLVAGSDGRDGPSQFSGAALDTGRAARAIGSGIDLEGALRRFDASTAVATLGIGLPSSLPRTNLTDLFLLARGPAK